MLLLALRLSFLRSNNFVVYYNNIVSLSAVLILTLTTSRKDIIYLIGYFILYSLILYYNTISREIILDSLKRYSLGNY